MKVPDVNILIYSIDASSPHHERIRPWWESLLSGDEPVGYAWNVLLGFIRLVTRPPVFSTPISPEVAFNQIDRWLAQPNAIVLQPTERHAAILRALIESVGTAGNLTTDAHLAALAIEYGGEVCSADNDFRRFRGLRYLNPLD